MNDGLLLSFFRMHEHTCKSGQINRVPLGLPENHFAMLLSGQASFISDGETVRLLPGDILYLPMNLPYRSEWDGKGESRFLSLYFTFSSYEENAKFKLQKLTDRPGLQSCMTDIYRAVQNEKTALALSLFYELYAESAELLSPSGVQSAVPTVFPAVTYLQQHSEEKVCVANLASMCHLSESYFYSCFKKQTGLSPIEYKNSVRCRRAAELLCHTNRKIEDIAGELGFSSPQYLRKMLFAFCGKTPKEIRKERLTL